MKQVILKRGEALVEEVPSPTVQPNTVLVRVRYSCISSGTELTGMRNSAQPLWQRALSHPQEVRKVVEMAAVQGLAKTRSVVHGRLDEGLAVGYSAAGTVVATGQEVDDLRVGDGVACSGTGYASHAELISVPRNLVVRVPDRVTLQQASTVALGAIALQGVRRANPTLGETFVIIGLGALGQLVAQILRANGCRVIGTDVSAARIELAQSLGLDHGIEPAGGDEIQRVHRLTGGHGADGVIITASGSSDAILAAAFKMCRRRGRVVLVGDVGLKIDRGDIYERELDFLVSTSYGPGRYDSGYEERGEQYPLAYVRWTETRNMAAYLDLLALGRTRTEPLTIGEFPLSDAARAYRELSTNGVPQVLALLAYDTNTPVTDIREREPDPPLRGLATAGPIRVAVVGPGGFVRTVHLPNLAARSKVFSIAAVVSRHSARAAAVARQFDSPRATTDYGSVLADESIDAVLIGTRHDTHGAMVLAALESGKDVFVEKPLALSAAELKAIERFFETKDTQPKPLLMTGYNRRFSPYLRAMKDIVRRRSSPLIVSYHMNAGYIKADSWVHGPEGGGRNLGEACHIYDALTYLVGERVVDVSSQSIAPPSGNRAATDNFTVSLRFGDGSLASFIYTSQGHRDYAKEKLELFCDGIVIAMDDYRAMKVIGMRGKDLKTRLASKGHGEELDAFAEAARTRVWPIPLWEQLQAAEIALEVQRQFLTRSD